MEPTDVKALIEKLFDEASTTAPKKNKKKRPFSDDDDDDDDPAECYPPKTIKTEQFTKDWLAAPLDYWIYLGSRHEWSFGAIAQLVDNAKDAQATKVEISIDTHYSKGNIPIMSVVDNGHGMSHEEIEQMVRIGRRSFGTNDRDRIGVYGIGFQSGTMKLGRDVIVLTQTSHSRSIVFLLQCLHKVSYLVGTSVPVITYHKQHSFLGSDRSIQSEAFADHRLKAVKEFLPINEDFIGEKFGLFGENGTGTQIYIWNLERSGSDYSLEWPSKKESEGVTEVDDILIRSRIIRPRVGHFKHHFSKAPLDYSLRSFLEAIFLNPQMEIYVQGSLVNSRPLAKSLHSTKIVNTTIMEKHVRLTLGLCERDWKNWKCGIFLYWRGRLIEAYKRVGSMVRGAVPGLVGVIDVTDIMNNGDDAVFLNSTKEAFRDCNAYRKLEEWLGQQTNEYADEHFIDTPHAGWSKNFKSDHELVQCDKCRKSRILNSDSDIISLPEEWFCCMPPYNGMCETPEEDVDNHGRRRFYAPLNRNRFANIKL